MAHCICSNSSVLNGRLSFVTRSLQKGFQKQHFFMHLSSYVFRSQLLQKCLSYVDHFFQNVLNLAQILKMH